MNQVEFLTKHGHMAAGCCVLGSCGPEAQADALAIKGDREQPKCFLWPDHTIGKRESRRIREEHNLAMNQRAKLIDALKLAVSINADRKRRMLHGGVYFTTDELTTMIELLHEVTP